MYCNFRAFLNNAARHIINFIVNNWRKLKLSIQNYNVLGPTFGGVICAKLSPANPIVTAQSRDEIRDCEIYKDEYKECTSFRARFHQYFIYGETLDCNQWKKDYNNCCKWTDDGDLKAAEAVIKSERVRRLERLRGHYQNDIWTKREAPPSDWDKPLPEWMVKRDENTYLAYKAKEMREGKEEESDKSFCSIM